MVPRDAEQVCYLVRAISFLNVRQHHNTLDFNPPALHIQLHRAGCLLPVNFLILYARGVYYLFELYYYTHVPIVQPTGLRCPLDMDVVI